MEDFESDACGWDPYPDYITGKSETVAKKIEKCGECRKEISKGEVMTIHAACEDVGHCITGMDHEKWEVQVDGNEWVTAEIVIACEECEDLRQSLIEAGHQPLIGAVRQCHNDLIEYKKRMIEWQTQQN